MGTPNQKVTVGQQIARITFQALKRRKVRGDARYKDRLDRIYVCALLVTLYLRILQKNR